MAYPGGMIPHLADTRRVPVSPEEWFTWSIIDAETIALTGFDESYEDTAEINIPSTAQGRSVVSIGSSAFESMTSLEYVEIPGSVVSIGNQAFRGASSLTSVRLNEGLETIGELAFAGPPPDGSGAPKITSITLPSTLTSLGRASFIRCPNLEKVIYKSAPTQGEFIFLAVPAGQVRVAFAEGVTTTPSGHDDKWGVGLGSVTLPSTMTSIGNNAFRSATSLESVEIPGSVLSIGSAAFWRCASLATVVLNEGLETIGAFAFSGSADEGSASAPKITDVTLPSTLAALGDRTFRYCPNLLNVNFLGNAPTASDPYQETPVTLTSYAPTGATGWPTGTPPLTWESRPFEYV